jgi:DsbC/DsbD-like thiol-disulfide interchange protein
MRTAIVVALLAQLSSLTPAKPGHATIVASPAEVNGTAGGKLALFVDVTPKPNIHVYAPGAEFYIPITVKLNAPAEVKAGKLVYPKSETITLLDEKVAVFQKPFRLTQDVTIDKSAKPGSKITVNGTVDYQSCDDKVCYPPESAAVAWTVVVK